MKSILFSLLVGLALPLFAADAPAAETPKKEEAKPAASTNEVAVLKFAEGEIVVEFWSDVAPKTVENFKKLAREKFYDGTASHRLIPGFMIQLGDPNTKDQTKEDQYGQGGPGYMIKAEFNDRPHVRGVLSMARSRNPDSAGSQFFVCFGRAASLDNQYTAFGKVIKGEDVLAKLEKTPVTMSRTGERSKPVDRVPLESVRIVPRDSIQ
jgi:peptidyl-prolyl cis-trans isomerase B (cyclophilin B)